MVSAKTFTFMYVVNATETILVRKLFKGGKYLRKYGINREALAYSINQFWAIVERVGYSKNLFSFLKISDPCARLLEEN